MPRTRPRPALPLALSALLGLLPLLAVGGPAAAVPSPPGTLLSDGTRVEHWRLSNGLRVVVRHVPNARTSAVTLAYRLGEREDPAGREGFAELAAQVAFTARAGDVPQRRLSDMDLVRPNGWSIKVTPFVTQLTEAAPKDLLPSVLHQVCQRLRGPLVTDALVDRQRIEVRDRLRSSYDASVEGALYLLSEQISSGRSAERAMRYATGQGLDDVRAGDLRTALAERLVPANAALCIVGDLGGLDLHRLLEHELGDVAAGTALPGIAWGAITSAHGVINRTDLKAPVAVLAVLAPPLSDTTHAFFTTFALAVGPYCAATWGKPEPPLTHRFQYSLANDPERVRFYPAGSQSVEPAEALESMLHGATDRILDSTNVRRACELGLWFAGGPLPPDLLRRAPEDASVTNTLSAMLAALELFGDEAFWEGYRRRVREFPRLDPGPLFTYFTDPHRQVTFILKPGL